MKTGLDGLQEGLSSHANGLFSRHFQPETPLYRPISPAALEITTGVVLCCMALLIWTCHIFSELQNVSNFASGLLRLPRGPTVVSFVDGQRRFEAISLTRLEARPWSEIKRASRS